MAPARGEIGRQGTRGRAMGDAAVCSSATVWSLDPQVGASSYETAVSEEKGQWCNFICVLLTNGSCENHQDFRVIPCILEACTVSRGTVSIISTWGHLLSSTLFYGTWSYVSQPHLHLCYPFVSTEKKHTG